MGFIQEIIHGVFLVKSYWQFPGQLWEFPLEEVQITLKTSMMCLISLKNCVRSRGTCLGGLDFSLRKAKTSLSLPKHMDVSVDPVSDFYLILFILKIKAFS